MCLIYIYRCPHILKHVCLAKNHRNLSTFLLFPLLYFFLSLRQQLFVFLLSLGHQIRIFLLNDTHDHKVNLQIGIARLKYFSLAQGAFTALSQRIFETFLAESMSTRRGHWFEHHLPANRTLKLFRELLIVLYYGSRFDHVYYVLNIYLYVPFNL